MNYIFRVQVRTAVGHVETLVNQITIEDTTAWGGLDPVLVVRFYSPTNVLLYTGTKSKNFSETLGMPVDVNGNIIHGVYRLETEVDGTEEEATFNYAYNPLVVTPQIQIDGYKSELLGLDVTDYTGYDEITRLMEITPPVGSGMVIAPTSGSVKIVPPNIFSGQYRLQVNVTWRKVDGNLFVRDGAAREVYANAYKLDGDVVIEGVNAYFEQYNTFLRIAPKLAIERQPYLIQIFNALHRYYYYVSKTDTLEAYEQLLLIYRILNPDYEELIPDTEEIVPFNIESNDHAHTNLVTVLEKFTNVGGALYWDGVEIPLGASLGKVAMSVGDTPDYLEDKIDATTIGNNGGVLSVKETYIEGLADGTTIIYDPVTKKYSAKGENGKLPTYMVQRWENSTTYKVDDVVVRTVGGVDYTYVSTAASNQGFAPESEPTKWRLDTTTNKRHDRNTDNYLTISSVTITSANITNSSGGLTGITLPAGTDVNRYVITKTGNDNEDVRFIKLPELKGEVVLEIANTGAGQITISSFLAGIELGRLDVRTQTSQIVIEAGERYTLVVYPSSLTGDYLTKVKSIVGNNKGLRLGGVQGDVQTNNFPELAAAEMGVGRNHPDSTSWTFGAGRVGDIGQASFSVGGTNEASGTGTFASGDGNVASGDYSVAMGQDNTAEAPLTFAYGKNSEASTEGAIAIGEGNDSNGLHSFVQGKNNYSEGGYSVAMGNNAFVDAEYGRAYGENTQVTAIHGKASGKESVADVPYSEALAAGKISKAGDCQTIRFVAKTLSTGAGITNRLYYKRFLSASMGSFVWGFRIQVTLYDGISDGHGSWAFEGKLSGSVVVGNVVEVTIFSSNYTGNVPENSVRFWVEDANLDGTIWDLWLTGASISGESHYIAVVEFDKLF